MTTGNVPDVVKGYAQAGWAILPIHSARHGRCSCGRSDCKSPGKHPRSRNGLKDATTDMAQVAAWYQQWPDMNIGLAVPHDHVVVDIDGPEGMQTLIDLGYELPSTA